MSMKTPVEIKASFEKAYWNLERHLPNENSRELAAATLRSVALECANGFHPRQGVCLSRSF